MLAIFKLSLLASGLFLCLVTVTVAHAGIGPGTGVVGSVHDMNMFAFVMKDPYQRVCNFCHVPHEANAGMGMLWNPALDSSDSGMKPYTWATPPNMVIPQDFDPLIGPSRLCMTCHDGVIAIDAHGDKMPAGYVISKNLDITHPIGFSYDDAMLARGNTELVDKTQHFASAIKISDTAGEYNAVTRNINTRIVDVLYKGSIVTCCTCHDVHNKENVTPDNGHQYNFLLWAKEEQSLLCLSCHIK